MQTAPPAGREIEILDFMHNQGWQILQSLQFQTSKLWLWLWQLHLLIIYLYFHRNICLLCSTYKNMLVPVRSIMCTILSNYLWSAWWACQIFCTLSVYLFSTCFLYIPYKRFWMLKHSNNWMKEINTNLAGVVESLNE